MQIELEPEVEAALVAKSATLGITAAEFSAMVLTEHSRLEPNLPMSDVERKEFMDRWVARMKANNPSFEIQNPYSQNWQAIKAEGRNY